MTPEAKREKAELQASLEATINYIFETKDTSILESPEYKKVRMRLAELLSNHPQRAATNYADGGPTPE